ncbi:unnamed protein product [Echinostoma caproni]|uniref:EF-hand domain-containing protein n=1 Tax=Echinostoma caproni TaxID=27848 RepID=A0A183AG18_9TREM|nr:unnamed protein product [Echinostoma caproni]
MEPFLEVFFAVDQDRSEIITTAELRKYVQENNLDESMITQWNRLFDPDNTGKITFEKFCDVLGIAPATAREKWVPVASKPPSDDGEITIYAVSLKPDAKDDILAKVKELSARISDRDQLAKELKQYLDEKYGYSWHVLLTDDSFWLEITYAPENSLHCRIGDCSYLMWMTPELL